MDIERIAFQKYLKDHGWHWARQNGSHIQYKKDGEKNIITIVSDKTLTPGIIKSALRRMNILDEQFRAEFYAPCKKRRSPRRKN